MSKKIIDLPSGSITDAKLGYVGDPSTGALSETSYRAMKDYFTQGIGTGSIYNPAQLNLFSASILTFTSSYVTDSASFNTRINSATGSGGTVNTGSLLLTSSFNTFTASYVTDSGSFNTRILNNSSSFTTFSSSYRVDSASFNTRITGSLTSSINIQEFTTGSFTWSKPSGSKWVIVKVWGGGGGGGAGRRGAAGSARVGGGGGGAGGYAEYQLDAASLPTTMSVVVGIGATGSIAITVDNTDGGTGGTGGDSSFGNVVRALGGGGGVGGAGGFGGGGGGGGQGPMFFGSNGAAASTTGGGGGDVGDQTFPGSTGGGSGGGISTADAEGGYGHGGPLWFYSNPRDAFTPGFFTSEGNAGVQIPGMLHGSGANGSSGHKTLNCPAGGAGANYSGGGGGGGASLNGFSSGAGGKGGDGHITVIASM